MKRVLITRPRKDAADFAFVLQELGLETIHLPTIDIHPVADSTLLDQAISNLDQYDWLVFTSVNAVDAVLERKVALGIEQFPVNLQIAAIGPKTSARLLKSKIKPNFVPKEYIAEAILPGLGNLNNRWVLLPMADIAHDTLPNAIREENGIAHVVTAYHTLPAKPDPKGFSALAEGVDLITFTSGSTALNFIELLERAGLDPFHLPGEPKIACIGPKTSQVVQDLGFSVDIEAKRYTIDGLAQAISSYLVKNNSHETI